MMSAPHVARVGTTKTCWVNFVDHCNKMNRDYKHVLSFVLSELGTDGSLDGKNQLIIKGKYTSKKLESILKKYIGMYVACNDCRSPNTVLERDHINKLYFVICKSCGSRRSVAAIKTGYHAVKKGEPLAVIHASDPGKLSEAKKRLLEAYEFTSQKPEAAPLIKDIIS